MNYRINTDTWFLFSLLFISALALLIFVYVAIPYFTRKKHLSRVRLRYKRKHDNYKRLEQKHSEHKITSLQEDNQKLQVDLKNDLQQMLQSNSKTFNLLPFFSSFEKIYPNFRHSLQKIIPDVTANELKFCAFLRLNLSSKEISLLLNVTPESVNKARYRLRKKTQLNSKDDLYIFLSSL